MVTDKLKQKEIVNKILPQNINSAIRFNNLIINQYKRMKSGEINIYLEINEENLAPYRQVAEELEYQNQLFLDKQKKYDQVHT